MSQDVLIFCWKELFPSANDAKLLCCCLSKSLQLFTLCTCWISAEIVHFLVRMDFGYGLFTSFCFLSPLLVGSVVVSGRSRWLWPEGIWGYTPRKCCFPPLHRASSLQRGAYDGLQGAAETNTSWLYCNSRYVLTNNNPRPGKNGGDEKKRRKG